MLRAALLMVMVASSAHAGGIVIESNAGERPANADTYFSPILDELNRRGFQSGDAVSRPFVRDVSRPGIVGAGLPIGYDHQLDAATQILKSGGSPHQGIAALRPLLDLAHDNSGAFVGREALRTGTVRDAMIFLAIGYHRDGDQVASDDAFAEVSRAFPDEKVSPGRYGAESNRWFQDARAKLAGFGDLVVRSSRPGPAIYVDEHLEGLTQISKAQLPAGDYRVFVDAGAGGPVRVHVAHVKPGQTTTLVIDPDFDAAVHTDGWVGLQFADPAARAKSEGPFAAALGNALGADQIVLLEIDARGKGSVVASLISKSTGERIRGGQVPLALASADQMHNLAHYLVGEGAAGEVVPIESAAPASATTSVPAPASPAQRDAPAADTSHSAVAKWGTAVLGLGGFVAGGVLVYKGNACTMFAPTTGCTKSTDYRPWGGGAFALGAVFAGISIYLFASDASHAGARAAYVVPTGDGGALVGYTRAF